MLAGFHTFPACQDEAYSPRFQLRLSAIPPLPHAHSSRITGKIGQGITRYSMFTCTCITSFLKSLISCGSAPGWGDLDSFWDTASDKEKEQSVRVRGKH